MKIRRPHMIITSEEQFLNLLKSKSRILNRPAPDPRRLPRYFECLDFSQRGIEAMLADRLDTVTGSLRYAREAVKEALREWEHFNKAQVRRAAQPVGVFLEKINERRAKVKLIECECRELNRLLDFEKAKVASEVAAVNRHRRGNVKFKGGVPHTCDGRELAADTKGVVEFKDTGELLDSYLDDLKQRKRAKAAARLKEDRERQERVNAARGITKQHRVAHVAIQH
jgi:hypothetical protein